MEDSKTLKSEENEKLESIEGVFTKKKKIIKIKMRRNEIKNEVDDIKKWKEKIKRKNI